MTQIINEIIKYICKNYPDSTDLSKARLTKTIYLVDWYYAVKYKIQMTDIEWKFNHYGPYVGDIIEIAKQDPQLEIINTTNMFNYPMEIIKIKDNEKIKYELLDKEKISVIEKVIEDIKTLSWNKFIKFVYETPPVKNQNRYSILDIVSWAK